MSNSLVITARVGCIIGTVSFALGIAMAFFFQINFNLFTYKPYHLNDLVQSYTKTKINSSSIQLLFGSAEPMMSHIQCIRNWANGYFYADLWIHHTHPLCGRRIFTSTEIHSILNNKTILFNGDSRTRRWFNTLEFMSTVNKSRNFKLIDPRYLERGSHRYLVVNNSDFYIEYQWNVEYRKSELKKIRNSYSHVVLGFGLHQAISAIRNGYINGNAYSIYWLQCIQNIICQACETAPTIFWMTSPFSDTSTVSWQGLQVHEINTIISIFNQIVRIALFHGGYKQNLKTIEINVGDGPISQLNQFGISKQHFIDFTQKIHGCCNKSTSTMYLLDIEKMLMPRSVQNRIKGDTIHHFGDAARVAMTNLFIHAIAYLDRTTTT